jgi:beta-lactamase class A
MARWTRPPLERDAALETLIRDTLGDAASGASVVVVDVDRDRVAEVNGSRPWYSASLYKLFVLFEAAWQEQTGVLDPSAAVEISCWYAQLDLGTLESVGIAPGDAVPVHEAVRYMVVASDNALATLVYDVVGGRHIAERLSGLGATATDVTTSALPTTASDVALVLEAIARGVPGDESAVEMRALLVEQWVRGRIPAGIPNDGSRVGNKTGDLAGAAHDAAIVTAPFGTYVIAILTDGTVGDQAFIELASAIHEYLGTAAP